MSQPTYVSTLCCGCSDATTHVAEISHYWNIPQVRDVCVCLCVSVCVCVCVSSGLKFLFDGNGEKRQLHDMRRRHALVCMLVDILFPP